MTKYTIYYSEGGSPDTICAKSWYWKDVGVVVFVIGGRFKDLVLTGVERVE